ncbi:MAG: hypothetical protein ACYSVY_11605, partial [Planctomycetota bacterium]
MESADRALPCAKCFYDLRGLPDGRCPECGAPFLAAELAPEEPGLALERWYGMATGRWRRAILPLRVCLSPISGFARRCRIERTLSALPVAILCWLSVWFVGLLLVRTGVGYLSNRLHGLESWSFEYAVRGLRGPDRFGFLLFVPLQLALIWVQCLAVSVVAMLIAWRSLSGRQVLQLATWLMPFSLVGGLFTILYEHAWYEFLGRWLQRDSYTIEEWMDAFPVNLEPFVSLSLPRDLGQDLLLYGNDL